MFGFMKKKDSDTSSAVKAQKSKGSKGFYLELEEATGVASSPKAAPSAASTVATPEVATPPEVTTPEVVITSEPKVEVTPEPTAPAKTPKAKTDRGAKKVSEPTPASTPAPTPEPVAAIVPEPEILPAYLVMNDTPRRRPGANMTMFKNMAQQVKK